MSYTAAKDWVIASLPVKQIEQLLDTKYSTFEHEDGSRIVRAPEWSLPEHLHKHVDTIQPTNSFFRAAPKSSALKSVVPFDQWVEQEIGFVKQYFENPVASAVCNTSGITPLCLRTLYGTINYKPQAAGKNKVGLTDYLGETNNRSDAYIFLEQFRPEAAQEAYQFKFDVVDGGNTNQVGHLDHALERQALILIRLH